DQFLLHGGALALVWFMALNVAVSFVVTQLAARAARRRARSAPLWLTLRLLPAFASVGFVACAFVPSYWRYEPRESVEGLDITLTAIAAAAIVLLVAAAARGTIAWNAAHRRTRVWLQGARILVVRGCRVPAYEIAD